MSKIKYFCLMCVLCFALFNFEANLLADIFKVNLLVANSCASCFNIIFLFGLYRGLESDD